MQLQWQYDENPLAVTGIDGTRVRIGSEWRERSFWVDARATGDWAPRDFAAIDRAAIEALLVPQPAIILIGTGARAQLLAPALQVLIMQSRCGVECMSNAAAARTYNVLLGEGRAVLAAFLIDQGSGA